MPYLPASILLVNALLPSGEIRTEENAAEANGRVSVLPSRETQTGTARRRDARRWRRATQ